ncbi:MAG: FAD:protein FMN transferase [Spirochaetales bacterium]|nr:FAD:protein FMN transferase [Spirochaetales bacterium]
MHLKHRRAVAAVLLFLLLLVSCSRKASEAVVHSEVFYQYFDTVSEISSYAGDSEEIFRKNVSSVSELLEHWHRLLDIYHEYEGMNNLCTVNIWAGGSPVTVDRDLIDFVLYAKDMCELTSGEMDISLGAVLSLWHEARNADTAYLPSDEELEYASRHVGFDRLEVDPEACTLRLSDPAASLDPGALGKGYAAERAAQMLISEGVTGYVINLGGNIRCIGTKADGSQWVTGIRDPLNPEKLAVTLKISDRSCVTSGGYERYFTVDGVRYAHIIDKDTLYPASGFSSVSVVCKDSALADALSTALFCMSYEDGLSLVSSLDDVQALWILDDGSLRYTKGLGPDILKT